MTDIDLVLDLMLVGGGIGIDLGGGKDNNGYELEATTRGQIGVTWRKQTAAGPYVEGTYTTSAVRENITEQIAVWVYGTSHSDREHKIQAIVNIISQNYSMHFLLNDYAEVWTCQPSDYTVDSRREFQHSFMSLVTIHVDRLPTVRRTYADNSIFVG